MSSHALLRLGREGGWRLTMLQGVKWTKHDAATYAAVVSKRGSQHHKRDGQKEENFQFWHAETACFAS